MLESRPLFGARGAEHPLQTFVVCISLRIGTVFVNTYRYRILVLACIRIIWQAPDKRTQATKVLPHVVHCMFVEGTAYESRSYQVRGRSLQISDDDMEDFLNLQAAMHTVGRSRASVGPVCGTNMSTGCTHALHSRTNFDGCLYSVLSTQSLVSGALARISCYLSRQRGGAW